MVSLHAFLLAAAALAGSNDTVLLHFTADWCGPCRLMQPTIQRLHEAGYPLREVNVDREPDLTRQFGVGPIPCCILVRNGQVIDKVVGPASFDRLARMFEPPGQAGAAPNPLPGIATPNVRAQSPDDQPLPLTRLPQSPSPPRDASPPVRPAASGAPHMQAPQEPDSAQQQAVHATVRLCVRDASGQSHGTGTIIDVHGEEALVLTCGHIFRDSRGQGEILVELCAPGATGPVRGQLVAYDADRRDIGLVSIRPHVPVRPVRVASTDCQPQMGDPVFSVGCDHASSPSVQPSTISAVNRYVDKAPHLEVLGHPVEGRSGGGLFTADGRLIGVCNAADLQEDRGIYAGLPTIHQELKAINQERIYAADPALADAAAGQPQPGGGEPAAPRTPLHNAATPLPPLAAPSDTEVICVVRSRNQSPQADRVVVISQPSPALLQLLEHEAHSAPHGPATPLSPVASAARHQPSPATPPVVRAQNY